MVEDEPDLDVNYATFRDCLSELVTSRLAPTRTKRRVKGRKNEIKPIQQEDGVNDVEDLAEFIDYLANEIYTSLDRELKILSYEVSKNDTAMAAKYSTPLDSETYDGIYNRLPPTVTESFESYSLIDSTASLDRMLEPVFNSYIDAITVPPPEHDHSARPDECEICERGQLPLTYHHLIPRQMHVKAVVRGWAKDWELQKVAWLCRACHTFVHRVATNEELAREWNAIDRLLEREDVRNWAAWIGRIRWKKR